MDDVIVYRREDDFLVVVNASNREKDLEHFRGNTETSMLRYLTNPTTGRFWRYRDPRQQGSYRILRKRICQASSPSGSPGERLMVRGASFLVPGTRARTGSRSTFPERCPARLARLVEAGATPAGLGARDTLRLEAGMCLYGNELDAKTTPLEAGIGFAVHLDKEERFIGQRALLIEDTEGLRKKLVGFEMEGRGIARHGHHVTSGAEIVGEVTSGTKSPTLDKAIGLALVDPGVDDWFEIVIRDNPVPAKAVPLPFYKRDKG